MTAAEKRYVVSIGGQRAGTLLRREDHTSFSLSESYIGNPHRHVLGLAFEDDLNARHRANMRLPPWFSNLLPEGVLREWVAETRGVSSAREMELLAQLGHDLPGAVEVHETDTDGEVSKRAREVFTSPPQSQTRSSWRFSLAGVAMKFSMLRSADRFTCPAVSETGDWIVKLPDSKFSRVPLNEYLMMKLAGLAGIDVPEVRLVHRDELTALPPRVWTSQEDFAYAVKRFDRAPGGARIHMEDLAQVRGYYPEDKYRGNFETVAALFYRGRDTASLQEFARRLAFCSLVGNGDAHLKNWSFLYENPRKPSISPAYDLVSTAPYRAATDPEDLGLRFGGSKRFERVSRDSFLALERRLGAVAHLDDVVADFVARVNLDWLEIEPEFGDESDLRETIAGLIRAGTSRLGRRER